MLRRPRRALAAASLLALAGCGSTTQPEDARKAAAEAPPKTTDQDHADQDSADQEPVKPKHAACKPVPPELLKRITDAFVAPVDAVVAYQARSTDSPGYTAITVGTDGFPDGVPRRDTEIPAPDFGLWKGELYTASGQAIRYTGGNLPETADIPPEPGSWGLVGVYDSAAEKAFDCVKDQLD